MMSWPAARSRIRFGQSTRAATTSTATASRSELIGFVSGDVDGTGLGVFDMIDVEDLIVEALERALRHGDEADRNIKIGEENGGLCQMAKMLKILLDILPPPGAPEGGNKADRRVRLDHRCSFPGFSNRHAWPG